MSSDGFLFAFNYVLEGEGGLVDDLDDPGGRTNHGVTQRVYDGWRASQGLLPRDVALIESNEVQKIYWSVYWLQAHCVPLVQRVDLLQLDTAINTGIVRAIRFLQGAAGITVDGIFGAQTAAAVAAAEYLPLVTAYCQTRETYYRRLVAEIPRLAKFLAGWLNRLAAVRQVIGVPEAGILGAPDYGARGPVATIPDYGVDPTFDF